MILEGTISNVTHFGAFVDVGVHQDGLVHISAMSDKFIKDPHEVVKAGEIVKVKVMEVEPERKRIALSLRLDDPLESEQPAGKKPAPKNVNNSKRVANHNKSNQGGSRRDSGGSGNAAPINNAFAEAFAKANKGK